ncbi:fimbrial protein [Enterobacteriaceae bacterium 4M9]|nr:fimbrial protein [Enterobacteriaceae bacterium 4M9]
MMKMPGVLSRKNRVACALALAMLPSGAWAYLDGEIIPDGPTHDYFVSLNNQTITANVAGGTTTSAFAVEGNYKARVFCSKTVINQPVYFEGRTSLSPTSDGYLDLNEYMDAKITIYIEGTGNGQMTIPFAPVSNQNNTNRCSANDLNGEGTVMNNLFASGSNGTVTFRLKKPIINGITISGTEVAEIYGRLAAGAGVMGSTPLARVIIEQALITVPDKCVIGDGSPITVDLGQIPNSADAIEKNAQPVSVDIPVKCEGGSFATANMQIKIGVLQGSPASFNSNYLSTTGPVDRRDLGISLTERTASQTIVPNSFYDIPGFDNNEGIWHLSAKPVGKPGTMIPEGDFQASATIVTLFP